MTIFIQMELCKETLQDYLDRDLGLLKEDEYFNPAQKVERLQIASQIVSALEKVHSEHNLIHRDLKPTNIFFSFEKSIKLGDFGLATKVLSEAKDFCPSPIIISRKTSNISRLKSTAENEIKDDLSDQTKTMLTKRVGTPGYGAPEQIEGGEYDQKADIFSLGLILFELFYPFCARMERKILVDSLRKEGSLPSLLVKENAAVAALIEQMVQEDSSKRPGIQTVRQKLSHRLSFTPADNFDRRLTFGAFFPLNSTSFVPVKLFVKKWRDVSVFK